MERVTRKMAKKENKRSRSKMKMETSGPKRRLALSTSWWELMSTLALPMLATTGHLSTLREVLWNLMRTTLNGVRQRPTPG